MGDYVQSGFAKMIHKLSDLVIEYKRAINDGNIEKSDELLNTIYESFDSWPDDKAGQLQKYLMVQNIEGLQEVLALREERKPNTRG